MNINHPAGELVIKLLNAGKARKEVRRETVNSEALFFEEVDKNIGNVLIQ